MSREFGDFQTPPELVREIIDTLRAGRYWQRALEPTCGQGNFISGLLSSPTPPRELIGIELQEQYVALARHIADEFENARVDIRNESIFNLNLGRDLHWQIDGPLLVVGNPPWVTNSELGALNSTNLPQKWNLKRLSGFDAMTGWSNFDIAEYICLKLIFELAEQHPTIALLCKTAVARNVFQFAASHQLPIGNVAIRQIQAKKWFGAAVDACLFSLDVGVVEPVYEARVYNDLQSTIPSSTLTFVQGRLRAHIEGLNVAASIDGVSQVTWRQGIKHDAAQVVELKLEENGVLRNKQGEVVQVESAYVYPLLKSSDLAGQDKPKPRRAVIVPQSKLGEDTSTLANSAPQLWAYLSAHRYVFEQRKSSIYKRQR